MKVSKTFRLSQEAVAKLDAQDNATQYIEDLILGSNQPKRTLQVVPYQQVEDLFEQYLNNAHTKRQEEVIDNSLPLANTPIELLAMIRELEQDRDKQLEYCQDADVAQELVNRYQKDIDILWADYHILKKEQDAQN